MNFQQFKDLGISTKTKQCVLCGEEKNIDDYEYCGTSSNKCHNCRKEISKAYYRNPAHYLGRMYRNQKTNALKRGHNPPSYTYEEFKLWVLGQKNYAGIWRNYERSGYKRNLAPSIDRLDDYQSYAFGNIRLITCEENIRQYSEDQDSGANQKRSTPVIRTNLKTREEKWFATQGYAGRQSDTHQANIHKCLSGERKTAGGYEWRYADEL